MRILIFRMKCFRRCDRDNENSDWHSQQGTFTTGQEAGQLPDKPDHLTNEIIQDQKNLAIIKKILPLPPVGYATSSLYKRFFPRLLMRRKIFLHHRTRHVQGIEVGLKGKKTEALIVTSCIFVFRVH